MAKKPEKSATAVIEKLSILFEAFLDKLDDKVSLEKHRGMIEVTNQKLDDFIVKMDSKVEGAQAVANVLLGKHEDARKENSRLRDELNAKVDGLDHQVHVIATQYNEAASTVIAASKKVSDAEALANRIQENQQTFFNKYFEKLIEHTINQQSFFNKYYIKQLIAFGGLLLGTLLTGLIKGCTP